MDNYKEGYLAFKEFCMATKHEEQRQAELREHQENDQLTAVRDNQQRDNRQKEDRRIGNNNS